MEAWVALQRTARLTRTWGDGYGYLMVATGRAEVMIDPVMNLWDAATMQPILEEAGGRFTDWRGRRPCIRARGSRRTAWWRRKCWRLCGDGDVEVSEPGASACVARWR